MLSDVKPYDPSSYSWWVGAQALATISLLIITVAMIAWFTRKKKQKTVGTLKPKPIVLPDIPAIQQKYMKLIDEIEQGSKRNEITARGVHQKLSVLLRYFVYEIKGVRTPMLTLAELKMTSFISLTSAVETYYEPEFDAVKTGDVPSAIATAREVVSKWS